MKRLIVKCGTYAVVIASFLFVVSISFAQNKLDIEHLMDGTYRLKINVYQPRFEDNDTYSYYDNEWQKHIVDKKGNDKIVERTQEEQIEGAQFLEQVGKNKAYIKDNNLFVNKNGNEKQITFDGDSLDIIIGQSVHRNEFGIEKGLYFSQDGNYLAYYRMDQSMVGDYPLVNTMTREAKHTPIKYPMAGMKSHEVEVWVYDFAKDRKVCLKTRKDNSVEQRENYLTNVCFSADGKTVYIQKLNRKQNHMWLEAYSSESGLLKRVLFEEVSNKYVEPEHPLTFIPNDNGKFLYFSEKDGWQHLYIYDTLGKEIKQLTKGNWMVNDIAGFNDKGTVVYIYATKDSPLERNFYAVNIKDGKITRITLDHGTHTVAFNPKGTRFIDSYSSTEVAYRTVIRDEKGKVIKELDFVKDPFDELSNKPIITIDSLIAKDGTVLYTRMIKPKDFNPNKKYPVIVYVYGGPHAQLITDYWTAGAGNFLPFLATQDYIVWTMDSRGSANRGYEFESAIWHNCGTQEIDDQITGINYLKTLPYVDANRIGVDGWSYGGFMTLGLTLRNPGVFKVATAGGPVIDWKWYEVMYGERYMGTPEDNPEGYEKASLLNYIDNIPDSVRILIMQGYQDNTVLPQHSLEFIRLCVEKKKPVDYFMYTNHEHNVRGKDRVELYKKIFRYYEDFLKK
ncbi:MAG: DPP IV N-terminal domain-containing protein [Bacteroidales bacterium]|nr:DPP IV N-terminal domain-containing protein [Bacteroidales bacterium]